MTTESDYEHVYQWVADGLPVEMEYYRATKDMWGNVTPGDVFLGISQGIPPSSFRLAPRTITITRTVTIPVPLREAPERGSTYWVLYALTDTAKRSKRTWCGSLIDLEWLEEGRCFATESEWAKAGDALAGLLKGEPE